MSASTFNAGPEFPLEGVSAFRLEEITTEVRDTYLKFNIRLVGKQLSEFPAKGLTRLSEKVPIALGITKTKSGNNQDTSRAWVDNSTAPPDQTNVVFILYLEDEKSMQSVKEILRTTVLRQQAANKLGEEAEMVPYLGFSSLDMTPDLELTTQDVCDVFIKPRCGQYSYTEHPQLSKGGTGPAGTLVIHTRQAPFRSLWESVQCELESREDDPLKVFLWIDILCMPQNSELEVTPEWLTTTLCDGVGQIGSSVLVLADFRLPSPLKRCWCLWETLASIQQGIDLSVIMPSEQRKKFDDVLFHDMTSIIKTTFDFVDSEKSKATKPTDQAQILTSIRDSIGFDGANLVVRDRLLVWLSKVSEAHVKDPQRTVDHLATATFSLRLAKMLSVQGRHAEAETLLRSALDTRTVHLGPNNELTLECSVALANVYRLEGKGAEAEVTLRKVCGINAEVKGDDHEDTLLSLATLTRVLVDRGNFEEAKTICEEVLAINENKYGLAHKRTLEALVTLSQLADLNTDSETAVKYLTKALPGFEQVFGKDAPQTLNVKADLAGFLAETEKFEEAEAYFTEAANKLSVALGGQHPWTIKAVTGLQVLAGIMGKPAPIGFATPNKPKPATIVEEKSFNDGKSQNSSSGIVVSGGGGSGAAPPAPVPEPAGAAGAAVTDQDSTPPTTDADAAKAQRMQYASNKFSSMRESRLEGLGPKSKSNHGMAKKHLRGWLEKLPLEFSQRERERMAAAAHDNSRKHLPGAPSSGDSKQKSAVGRALGGIGKLASSMGGSFVGSLGGSSRRGSSLKDSGAADPTTGNEESFKKAKAAGNWRKRFFQVQSNQKSSSVVYWSNEDDCRNGRETRGNFPLDDLNSRIFENSPLGPLCFAITGPRGRLHLRAPSAEDKVKWIEVFKAALEFRGAAEKARLLEMGAGEAVAKSQRFSRRDLGQLDDPGSSKDWVLNWSDLSRSHSRLFVDGEGTSGEATGEQG